MMRAAAFLVMVASCRGTESAPPVPPTVQQPPADAAAVDAPRARFTFQLPTPGSFGDDLPHRTHDMRVLLADAQTCLPAPHIFEGGHDDPLSLAIDSFAGDLVVCAQAPTRRGVSVFFDFVSYGCWNVDPKTGFVTRRRDLPRSFFRCQDGGCGAGATEEISYDGTAIVEVADPKLRVVDRTTKAERMSVTPTFDVAHQAWIRGDLTYVGGLLFAHADDDVFIYDGRGALVATIAGQVTRIVSDKTVVVLDNDGNGTRFDLASHATTKIALPADAVEYRGTLYAIDEARRLVVVDPKTYRERSAKQLAICK